ncbi:MAG: hypothetical protein NC200_02715 [Candidatus Gastranaerophilales bacterium]|nr:hypothetical protein [Candidatus Gastranaerophilales bacterium]
MPVKGAQKSITTRVSTPPSRVYTCVPDCCRVAPKRTPIDTSQNLDTFKRSGVTIGGFHELPDSITMNPKYNICNWYLKNFSGVYKVEKNKGINPKNARDVDICLAKYSQRIASEMDTAGACYTGAKYALWDAGVINDYGDMPKGSAHDSISYFDKNPNKFVKVNVKQEDLKKLPAGMIVVYEKEGTDGHIAITNGYGQETSDCTDNMKWLEKHGKGAKFHVYKLSDGWSYNPETKKLDFDPNYKVK